MLSSPYQGIVPNVQLDACTREQLQKAHPDRFFPCPDISSSDVEAPQDAETIAGLQQGTAAWHRARSCHVTGSQLADLLGFSCPAANKELCKHQVYQRVKGHEGYHKLLHCIGALRADQGSSNAAATRMEPFGQLACTWGTQHEAIAHHTLLQHAPPGSLLIDTGFVTPALDAEPAFYNSILTATPSNCVIGSLGDIAVQSVRDLRLGCSLDGLLLTPVNMRDGSCQCHTGDHSGCGSSPQQAGSSNSNGVCSSGSSRDVFQTSSSSGGMGCCPISAAQLKAGGRIRRAPPYTWAREAGYTVACVEVKCPTPFWTVTNTPWAFACVGQDKNKPYKHMRASHYCQSQLSMLVTGTECCVYVVWTRGRTWITHVPINRPWLHACLHLLLQVQQRYVAPDNFQPPPTSLFWDPAELQGGDTRLSELYRRFVEATAVLSAGITSQLLPDPLYRTPYAPKPSPQQQQEQQGQQPQLQQQQHGQQQQQGQDAALPDLGRLSLSSANTVSAAAEEEVTEAAAAQVAGAIAATGAAVPAVSSPPPGWHVNSSGRQLAHWMVLEGPAGAAAPVPLAAAAGAAVDGTQAADAAPAGAAGVNAAAPSVAAAGSFGWLPVHTCLVKSVGLPQNLQRLLQQDRWFLDRLDPDSSLQPHLGVQQAWLSHPLLDELCQHPQGVLALLQRLHTGLPPLHIWAAAAGTAAATAAGAAPAAAAGGGGLSPVGAGAVGNASTARGISPGKLVLALLLKTEKLNCLDLSPVWKQLPQPALDVLAAWRAAAQQRAAAAAQTAAATATAASTGTSNAAATTGTSNAAAVAGAGAALPEQAAAGTSALAGACTAGVAVAAPTLPTAGKAGAGVTTTAATTAATGERSCQQAPRTALTAALATWQQRQLLRRQQRVANLRRCMGRAGPLLRPSHKPSAQAASAFAPAAGRFSSCTAKPSPRAGVSKPVARSRRAAAANTRSLRWLTNDSSSGAGSSGGSRGSSGRLANSFGGLQLQSSGSSDNAAEATAAVTAAAAATAIAPPLLAPVPAAHVTRAVPVVAAAAATAAPMQVDAPSNITNNAQVQLQGQQQEGSTPLLPAAKQQHQQQTHQQQQQRMQARRRSLAFQQAHARRLLAAAAQQQRAARLARYQAAFRSWSLTDMLEEVAHLQVAQQLLQQPVHETLQAVLAAQQQAVALQQQEAKQQQHAAAATGAALRPAFGHAATGAAEPKKQARASSRRSKKQQPQQEQQQEQQQNQQAQPPAAAAAGKVRRQKQASKPAKQRGAAASDASAGLTTAAAAAAGAPQVQVPNLLEPHNSRHIAAEVVSAAAAEAAAAAAANGRQQARGGSPSLAAFTVVGPRAVLRGRNAAQEQEQ